jgi:hypothetical protein
MNKFTITDSVQCPCGKKVDVVEKTDSQGKCDSLEYISYHLVPEGKGFCGMSMIETMLVRLTPKE